MPIEYTVSDDGLRIEAFPAGVLDINEAFEYFRRLQNDRRVAPGAVEIVRFEQVTDFRLSYLEIKSIAESYQEPRATRMIKATIFVCETDLAYGIGRMLQTLHGITNPEHRVVVVRSVSDLQKEMSRF
jgi:hypothetical protein